MQSETNKSKIKTSLELALEKVKNLQVDDESVRLLALRKQAQLMVGEYLRAEGRSLTDQLAGANPSDLPILHKEIQESLLGNIVIPKSREALVDFVHYFAGIASIKPYSIASIEAKLMQLFEQYLTQRADIEQRIKQQFLASMGQMEQQLAAKMGNRMKLNPESNPEFLKQKAELMRRFNGQYEGALEHLKEEIRSS